MLESILKAEAAEKRPYEVFFLALIMGIAGLGMATLIGRGAEMSHLAVAFICIAGAPLMCRAIDIEEEDDEKLENEKEFNLLHRHGDIFEIYGFYFLGIIVAFSLAYALMPQMAPTLFGAQVTELGLIRGMAMTGNVVKACGFFCLFENNVMVLLLVVAFSFIFGAGAIYIITWNASIVGVLIGTIAVRAAEAQGQHILVAYIIALPVALISLFPHGIFEIGAYFFGGLAGGMLSASLVRGHLPKKVVIKDIATILLLAIAFVAVGAVVESGA